MRGIILSTSTRVPCEALQIYASIGRTLIASSSYDPRCRGCHPAHRPSHRRSQRSSPRSLNHSSHRSSQRSMRRELDEDRSARTIATKRRFAARRACSLKLGPSRPRGIARIPGIRACHPENDVPDAVNPERINPERIDPEHIDPERINPEHIDPERINAEHIDPEHIDSEHSIRRSASSRSRSVLVLFPRTVRDLNRTDGSWLGASAGSGPAAAGARRSP
jgi:hypothetical protein